MSPRVRLGVTVAALTVGLTNLVLLLWAGPALEEPPAYLVIRLVGVCWSFVAAGLVALTQQPQNRCGMLMVAFGLTWSIHGLATIDAAPVLTVRFLLAPVPDAVLGHLIAVFPEGRATTPLQRGFLVVNYAATVPLAAVQLLLSVPTCSAPRLPVSCRGQHRAGQGVLVHRSCSPCSWSGCARSC